jgi:hypothetical protein
MAGYVIEYNRRTGEWQVHEFLGADGPRRALRERLRLEESRVDPDIELASINADSLETVRKTHSRYFQGTQLLPA